MCTLSGTQQQKSGNYRGELVIKAKQEIKDEILMKNQETAAKSDCFNKNCYEVKDFEHEKWSEKFLIFIVY